MTTDDAELEVALPADLLAAIDAAVERGAYDSRSAVVAAALADRADARAAERLVAALDVDDGEGERTLHLDAGADGRRRN